MREPADGRLPKVFGNVEKKMNDIEKYCDLVRKGFESTKQSRDLKALETENATMYQEDIFKLYWMARVRFSSFISTVDEADEAIVSQFTAMNMLAAKKNRSKLGELICVVSVVICDKVSDKVREMAETRPAKHSTASEYLVVVDLPKREIYYYTGPILYGVLYEKFEREYINGHFGLPLKVLSMSK